MILSIRHKGLKELFESGKSGKVRPGHRKRIQLILTLLHAAKEIRDVNIPGSGLHQLKGEYEGFWAIRVSGNWRLIFRFEDGDVSDLDYLDYH